MHFSLHSGCDSQGFTYFLFSFINIICVMCVFIMWKTIMHNSHYFNKNFWIFWLDPIAACRLTRIIQGYCNCKDTFIFNVTGIKDLILRRCINDFCLKISLKYSGIYCFLFFSENSRYSTVLSRIFLQRVENISKI